MSNLGKRLSSLRSKLNLKALLIAAVYLASDFCFAHLTEKLQYLHWMVMKTLLMLIDFYILNLLPRVSCYVAMWFNSLLSAAYLRFRTDACAEALHGGCCHFQTHPSRAQYGRGLQISPELCSGDENSHQADSKGALGEESCWWKEPPRPLLSGFGVGFRSQRHHQAWSCGERAEGAGGGSSGLSSTRQAEAALPWRRPEPKWRTQQKVQVKLSWIS